MSNPGSTRDTRRNSQHQPVTPTVIGPWPDCSPSMENQYRPLMGPGTDKRTSTRSSRERMVKRRETPGLASAGLCVNLVKLPIVVKADESLQR